MSEWKKLDDAIRDLYIVVMDELPIIKTLVERLDLFLRKLDEKFGGRDELE